MGWGWGVIVPGSAPACAHIRPHISLRPTAGAPAPGSGFIERKGLRDGLMGLAGSLSERLGLGGTRKERARERLRVGGGREGGELQSENRHYTHLFLDCGFLDCLGPQGF